MQRPGGRPSLGKAANGGASTVVSGGSRMVRTAVRAVCGLVVVGLLAGTLAAPAGGTLREATQGVSDDEIEIVVLVADLTQVRAQGFNLPAKLTTERLLAQWEYLANQAGKINGRRIKITGVGWDPLDATSFDRICVKATQDTKPFLVAVNSGYRQDSVGCITVDNNTPFYSGDPAYGALQEASGRNLVTLAPSAEALAKTTAQVAGKQKLVPASAKIGILSANGVALKAAGDTLEKELKRQKLNVVRKIELNTLQGDNTAVNREAAAAVATLQSAGVDTVFVLPGFTSTTGFFQEVKRTGADFNVLLVDTAAAACTQFGASRTPVEAAGAPCVTTWDTRAVPTADGVEKDNAFEAECRKKWEGHFGDPTIPGVPAGDLVINGVTLGEDMTPNPCTMMSLLIPAIKKAGRNVTWAKVYDNLMKTTSAPAAYMSDGEGGFAKGKPYFANKVHLQKLAIANANTPKAANGTYNGCPQPTNCFIPELVDGEEWFPIAK